MRNKSIFSIFIIVTVSTVFHSCKKKEENPCFKREVIAIDKFDKEITLKGTKVNLEDIYQGWSFVCDLFLIFHSCKSSDYYYQAFDIKNGKHIDSFCPKGEEPDDFLSCDESIQLIREDGDSKMWVRNYKKQNIRLINFSQSIAQQKNGLRFD